MFGGGLGNVGDKVSGAYDKAKQLSTSSQRGFTPFQFSSRKMQMSTSQMGGLIPDNPISSLANEALAWYEMWINPESISWSQNYMRQQQHTAKSIVTFHYRPETITMQVKGVCGWIGIGPQEEEPALQTMIKTGKAMFGKGDMPVSENSPKIFLKRLKDLADEPMYFTDIKGIEHYNTKFLKIYTKQFPNGLICEGYFIDFSMPESGEDTQTINYSFTFVIELTKKITALQKMAGMFSSTAGPLGKVMRGVPGVGL